jgi:hypothetical protein
MILSPPSNLSASFLRASALNFLKARSILSRVSVSLVMILPALKLPVRSPVSPPTKRPPAVKKKYVARSPKREGRRSDVRSGIVSEE